VPRLFRQPGLGCRTRAGSGPGSVGREKGKGRIKKGRGMAALQACRGCPTPREAVTGCAAHIWPPLPARPKDRGGEGCRAEPAAGAIETEHKNQQNNFPFLKLEGVCTPPCQDKGRISSQQREKQHKATSQPQEAKKPFSFFMRGYSLDDSCSRCGARCGSALQHFAFICLCLSRALLAAASAVIF